jgi:D-alanine-D-alanine ligase
MPKINMSIEIVISTDKRLSSMSFDSRVEIKDILEKRYSDVRITDVNSAREVDDLIVRRPDLVFLGMKFVPDNSRTGASPIWLSERLAEAGIAYTGSGKIASMLEHNKQLAKQQVFKQGLATAASLLLRQGEVYNKQDIEIDYPIFIKPVDGGGGSGINEGSLVHNYDELVLQVTWLTNSLQTDALLESYLPGREFSVGILQEASSGNFHMLPLEIVAPINRAGSRYLSSRIKRADAEQTLEITDKELKSSISVFALRVFEVLGGQDYGRIDIRMDSNGLPHFLEANLLPSLLNNYGNLPKASLMNIGLTHDQLIFQIATLGMAKNTKQLTATDDSLNYLAGASLQGMPA